jgi:hypothetical protein
MVRGHDIGPTRCSGAAYAFKLGAQLEQPDVAAKLNRELSANRQAM